MAVSNSTTLNDLVGQIVSSAAQSYAYSARIMRPLIQAIAVPPGAGSITVPRFDEVVVGPLVEGVAPTATAMTTTGVTLTPTERGVYKQISKRLLHADPFSDLSPYGEQMGAAMAQDEDALILDEATFTTRLNDAGALAVADILEAIATLEGMNAPQPYFAVFHPASWAKLRTEMANASTFGMVGEQIVGGMGQGFVNRAGFVGMPFGIPSFITTQTNVSGDTPARHENYVFSASSIACAYIQDIGIDIDDNVTARAIDLVAWYSVDCANINDFGVIIEDTV